MPDINLLSSKDSKPPQPVIQPITPTTIPAGIIGQRQLKAGFTMVKLGLASERPLTTNEITLYFATDTYVMSYWTGTGWVSGSAFS